MTPLEAQHPRTGARFLVLLLMRRVPFRVYLPRQRRLPTHGTPRHARREVRAADLARTNFVQTFDSVAA